MLILNIMALSPGIKHRVCLDDKIASATQVAAVEQALMTQSGEDNVHLTTSCNSMLFDVVNCGEDEVPYCVDCEDVGL